MFQNVLSSLTGNLPISIIFVAILIRRMDFVTRRDVQLPETFYFQRAMTYFRDKYNDSKVLFLVGSDDHEWCEKNLILEDILILTGTLHEDMSTLSFYNHAIMSHGTYSWWVAFLTGGEVVYIARDRPIRKNYYPILDPHVE